MKWFKEVFLPSFEDCEGKEYQKSKAWFLKNILILRKKKTTQNIIQKLSMKRRSVYKNPVFLMDVIIIKLADIQTTKQNIMLR